MSDLNARCLILASNAFLTENLTEEVLALDDDLIYAFIEENKSEMVQDYSPEQIWEMIDDHAQRLKVFVEAELSKTNEQVSPLDEENNAHNALQAVSGMETLCLIYLRQIWGDKIAGSFERNEITIEQIQQLEDGWIITSSTGEKFNGLESYV
ncbi:hypothetical protein ACN1T8_001348 [Vibrio cholerae]|uniref:hypothetical protein n=1 Tax=Vibrio cholerae TaxID=666 RepID=UPI001C92F951|nr:hypothetical protein [Vibrio cholerae]MBY4641994.1 hypothetical protein [Vibrio cholerae]MCR9658266.1 hypothetical protein [Vibrio cholerae]MCR9688947.1 hypothetical protein [Vibrio cholerae]MCR9737455.1 hypothetical protein [Vibrio cholerae]MCR9746278.1 hypothetical protein [Vibrio cholerae]